jgi:8-oxo-dGTP pyrophosphatase MutT (NUDIX family)
MTDARPIGNLRRHPLDAVPSCRRSGREADRYGVRMADEVPKPEFAAATAIVVRDGDAGLELLMLKRSDHGQFANMWVFPGGKVDPSDPGETEMDKARHAAAREAFEEVQLQLDVDAMVAWSHWSPPSIAPKRFLTWFFVAPWQGDEPVVDGHEIVEYRWVSASVASTELRPVAPPTFVTLHQLAPYATWASITADADHVVERFVTRISNLGPRLLLWEGDSGYETGEPDEGPDVHRLVISPDEPMRYLRGIIGQ